MSELTALLGRRVLVVEDVVTTGASVMRVASLVPQYGGELVGGVCMVNRGLRPSAAPWLRSMAYVSAEDWSASECPMCQAGEPLNTNVGHAKAQGEPSHA